MYGIIRSGMSTAMHEIAVVSNNIANSGSTGFKKSDVSFNDIYGSATPTPWRARKPGSAVQSLEPAEMMGKARLLTVPVRLISLSLAPEC